MSWDPLKLSSHQLHSVASYWDFCFLTGHSPSLRNWNMGSLAVTGCWFAVSHCALNNSMTTSKPLLCYHLYIWSDFGDADSIWCKVLQSLLLDKHRSESVYPHNFRLVAFGKRSYIERRRDDIASDSIAIKYIYDTLIGLISFHFVQAHCLAWVTALLKHPEFIPQRLSFSLGPFWRIPCCWCYPAQLDWFEWRLWYLWFVGCINGRPLHTLFYFWIRLPNDLVGWVLHHHVMAYFPNFEFFYQWRYWEL